MNACNHIGWFQLAGDQDFHLHYGNRTRYVVQEMTHPSTQYPSMVFFIGKKSKDIALRQIFPNNNLGRGQTQNINLRLDSTTFSSDFPLLLADGDPFAICPYRLGVMACHENRTFPIAWRAPRTQSVTRALYARLVSLFSDVICIFADDFGGLHEVGNLLIAWIRLGSPSRSSIDIRPRVVIVVNEEAAAATHNVLDFKDLEFMLQQEDQKKRDSVFSSITLMHIAGDHISELARHRRLKEVLLGEVDKSRIVRMEQRMLFSASHFLAFVERAIYHVTQTITVPFDFIQNTRLDDPVDHDFCRHLFSFIDKARAFFISYEDLGSFIASTLLLDAYPPRMHKFAPINVFQTLYNSHCYEAFQKAFGSQDLADTLCKAVEDQMERLFLGIDLGFETAIQLHASNINRLAPLLKNIISHTTCLFCLRRKPEHILTCRHAICDTCIIRFGSRVVGQEHLFEISWCILCSNSGKLRAKVKPNTAGARLLCIDGGGARGVVPLEYLGLLQENLGSELRIQDLFEEAFGTSSGGLIIIGLFLKDWDVPTCIDTFDLLVRDVFGMHLTKHRGIWARLRTYFRCWLSDGCYDVAILEKWLKELLGEERRMFDHQPGLSGSKVAVTATTISDASTFLFSNYNGCGSRNNAYGYKHVRPENIEDEPFLWEAARVTSAAPVLFRSAQIKSLGSFQDGALKHNNPIDLAVWECQKLWASPTMPDVVLSLGTGTEDELKSPKAPNFRHVFNDGFIPRLYRSFLSSLDGERRWSDSVNRLDDQSRANYFRLNVRLPDKETSLDDIEQINNLRRSVHLQPQHTDHVDRITFALLAAAFYFELESKVFNMGQYTCKGLIRCRNHSRDVSRALARLSMASLELSTQTESLGMLTGRDICSYCHLYCKQVSFTVRSLDDVISISLRSKDERRNISGSPNSIAWFVRQQRLDSPFGNEYHDLNCGLRCIRCEDLSVVQSLPGKRRGTTHPSESKSSKRPRLFL